MDGDPDIKLTADNFEASANSGKAYIFHMEHSTRDKLGGLSMRL